MTDLHPLARAHFAKLPTADLVLEHPNHFEEEMDFLNLNINNFREGDYRFYPDATCRKEHTAYLKVLPMLSNVDHLDHMSEKNIIFTAGSLGGIEAVIRAFCEPGEDRIVITNPTFMYYAYAAAIEKVGVIDFPLQGQNLDRLNLKGILASQAKVLFLCNPNNPVGSRLNPDDVIQVLENFKGIVVMDEAYLEWSDLPTHARLLPQYPNLMITRTFAKAWGMAGARIGAVLANEPLINALKHTITRFSFSIPVQELLQNALANPELILEFKARNKKNRQKLQEFLSTWDRVDYLFPSDSSYLTFKMKDEAMATALSAHTARHNLRILDMSKNRKGLIRISIGNEAQTDRLLELLQSFEQ